MAGSSAEESGVGVSSEGISIGQQRCQSGEALVEWRSSEQVENGIASTSPPYWDTDDDDDCGPKPSELYGKYTWKIDKFSQINKRELRSNEFEVGGYKWYILIYPQGCDVCNHLSLFLCVANHDKLLPGWSHFAQFTIAVVNKDPKKSKYSDTLHRFWKKEHDWGWKKFMELSKVLDGFIDADTLIIKAQVQVIRERADRPFRCLDCQYRRELVRVYLTNVEQICRRFVEERRDKLGKLIEDKARWSSFCTFWLGIDQNARRRMSKEKSESILKVVVKHFFIEKEVTSTLVMDSLYSGLKALESQTKSKNGGRKMLEGEELPVPIVRIEKDMFILEDDVLLLLERAALEPLPPKDEKGPQNRTKDGGLGEEFSKDSIERDERRLTELGRRTIETFVLAHIFSKIEVAYQEVVALKRQEELIREEEAAWMAEEQKAKRSASEKEKKSKKKQAKQKRNNRKAKDKGKSDKTAVTLEEKSQHESPTDGTKDFLLEESESVLDKSDILEDISDVSDSVDSAPEVLQPDSDDRDSSPVFWDTDTSEVIPPTEINKGAANGISVVQNGDRNRPSVMDDSSSTCSTDSLPSVVMNGPYKLPNPKAQKSPSSRGRNQLEKPAREVAENDMHAQVSEVSSVVAQSDGCGGSKVDECKAVAVVASQDQIKWPEQHVGKKEEESVPLQRRRLFVKDDAPSKEKAALMPSSSQTPSKAVASAAQLKSESKPCSSTSPNLPKKPSSDNLQNKSTVPTNSPESPLPSNPTLHKLVSNVHQLSISVEKPNTHHVITSTAEKLLAQQGAIPKEKLAAQSVQPLSRPLSAPRMPGPRPTAPVVSLVQTAPLLSRSVSAAGRLGPDPSSSNHSYIPQSYRNAMMGNPGQSHPANSALTPSISFSQLPAMSSPANFLPNSSERIDLGNSSHSTHPGFSFGLVNHKKVQNGPRWAEPFQRETGQILQSDPSSSSFLNNSRNVDKFNLATSSGRNTLADEFPHLDIINDLLDDDQLAVPGPQYLSFNSGPRHMMRQFALPGELRDSLDQVPSTSSRGFERVPGCHDEFDYIYGSPGGQFHLQREMNVIPQPNLRPYANGTIEGMIQNQWHTGSSDLLLGGRTMDGDESAYQYHVTDYRNLSCGSNGYTLYRPGQ